MKKPLEDIFSRHGRDFSLLYLSYSFFGLDSPDRVNVAMRRIKALKESLHKLQSDFDGKGDCLGYKLVFRKHGITSNF